MNDLIRRSDLYNEKPEWLNTLCEGHEEYNSGWNNCNEYWLSVIAEIPTAYDVDKVLDKLDNLNPVDYGSPFSYEAHNGARDALYDAIDIVERGGIE